jgi:hypothetical protein
MTAALRRSFAVTSAMAILFCALPTSLAQDAPETGSIEVLQDAELSHAIGTWTLIRPDNTKIEVGKTKRYINEMMYPGRYTIFITNADGATAKLVMTRNGTEELRSETPKITFDVAAGDVIQISVVYAYTITGLVSVTSDPANIAFTLRGPNGLIEKGETPMDYPLYPRGQYSVQYELPAACSQPQPKSDTLVKDSRIGFHITFKCDALDALNNETTEKKLQFVTMMVNGKQIPIEDVPLNEWFATYVHAMTRTGIMSGYNDENGVPTGRFGPGDPVSLAQLAKVAHEVASINEDDAKRSALRNTSATGTWFEQYIRSAESMHWLAFRDSRTDLSRPATRAEVVATLLQALNVPRLWPTGTVFSDVSPEIPYADCIETATDVGIVSAESGSFRPGDPVNRAELAKMVSIAMEEYLENSPEITGQSRDY